MVQSSAFKWQGPDSNRRPRGYEPRELPGCSTPRHSQVFRKPLKPFPACEEHIISDTGPHRKEPTASISRRFADFSKISRKNRQNWSQEGLVPKVLTGRAPFAVMFSGW